MGTNWGTAPGGWAAGSLGRKLKDFQAIADNLRTNPDYSTAVPLIAQAESVMLAAFDGSTK